MHRWILLIILILNQAPISVLAGVVPFDKELRPEINEYFNKYAQEVKTSSHKAHRSAFQIFNASLGQNDNDLRTWAVLTYSYSLIENDSTNLARKLLTDSVIVNWANAADWIQSFQKLCLGQLAVYSADYNEAETLFSAGLAELEGQTRPILRVHLMQALANNARYQGKLDLSINRWYEALAESEKLGDSTAIVTCYTGRGTVRFIQGELAKAAEDIELMFNYYQRIGNQKMLAYGYSLFGLLSYQNGNFEKSIEENLKSYEIRKQISDLKGQGESLNNLALGHMGLKNWNQALRYLEEAIQVKTSANDQSEITVILNNAGHCYQRLGQPSMALKYFDLALTKGLENGQVGDAIRSYRNITNIHQRSGNYKEAFETQSKMYHLKDSLLKSEKREAISELEVKYETQKKEQEINLLQKDKTIVTNRWLTLVLGLFLAIVSGFLFIDNQKRKHREERTRLLAEDELKKAELRIMADLLEHNRNRLSLYTENLLKKSELVSELEARLGDITFDSEASSAKSKELMEDFSGIRILTDDDWVEFKELFNDVHSGLLQKLLNEYDDLTIGEQRLFLLMKLDLSSKEIANILGVSPDSVKKSRYRLRKKLALNEGVTLQTFVAEFS